MITVEESIKACIKHAYENKLHCTLVDYPMLLGADWELDKVITLIKESKKIDFHKCFLSDQPCLCIETDDKVYIFDQVHQING